jgi:hypothetical protein
MKTDNKKADKQCVISSVSSSICCFNCKHLWRETEYCNGDSTTCGKFEQNDC